MRDREPDGPTPADGVELTRLLANLAELVRLLAEVTTLEALLEIAGDHVQAGLRCGSVSFSRLEPGTARLHTMINVGRPEPTEQPSAHAALVVNNNLWGELHVTYARADEANGAGGADDHSAYLEVYLAIVESALTRVTQLQTLERLANRDPMTGLANRRALDEAAAAAFAQLDTAHLTRMTVVAFDLNNVKYVNDQFGRAEGDRLILSAGSLVRAHFTNLPGSVAARTGGDEFTVLVLGHSPEEVASSAQNTCSAIAELPRGTGASCGMATADGSHPDSSVGDLFRRADAALHRSRRAGRLVALHTAGPPGLKVDQGAVLT